MPKDFTSTTFSEVYRDDYADSDNYYRILFNSGRPLQARELTQLQTILQEQITRFGNNIFLDGAAVSSAGAGLDVADYIIIESLPSGTSAKDYEGVLLQGPPTSYSSGIQFFVTHAEEATDDGDFPTLYGTYRNYNQSVTNADVQDEPLTFAEADELTDIRVISGLDGLPNVTVRTQPGSSTLSSTGKGLLFGVQGGYFWTQGFFVFTDKQKITVSKYDETADVDVGFEVQQDIVTVDDTEALYDNQGAVPNLSSPGADRYRIRLILTERGAVDNPSKFVFFAKVRNGDIVQVKGGSDSFNEIERRMAVRQDETNGNFIANAFDIRYKPGDSADALRLIIPGDFKGLKPTAYVDGYRLKIYADEEFHVAKPTSYTEELGVSSTIEYENYVNVKFDSAGGNYLGSWTADFNVQEQSKIDLIDNLNPASGNVIGSARIKHIVNTLDDSEGYRLHVYDVKMDAGKNFRTIKTIRPTGSSGNAVPVKLSSDQLYVVGPENSTNLHLVPGGRAKSVFNLSYSVQREFEVTSSGGSQLTITTQTGETFDNLAQWIFINRSTGATETVAPTSISLNSSDPQSAVCSVGGSSQDYTVFAYVQKNNPQPRTKTFSKHSAAISSVGDSNGVFRFNVYDGIELLEARADSANGRDVSDQLIFDNGQRDNYYGKVELTSNGLPSDVSTVYAKFSYFDWGASGDYFAVNSYVLNDSFAYNQIPVFTSPRDGEVYPLTNHIDFRSKLDTAANSMSSTDRFEVVRSGDVVAYDAHLYNPRVDHVALGYNQVNFEPEIRINQGVEALNPLPPETKNNEMVLFEVTYGGNTLNTKDINVQVNRFPRYQMSDIHDLKERIDTLEETVSLSFLEQRAINLVELNGSGEVRSKTGFFVDDFKKGFTLTSSFVDPLFRSDPAIVSERLLRSGATEFSVLPKTKESTVQILYDSDNKFGGRTGQSQYNVVRKGDLLYLDHVEVLDSSLVNEVISWYSDGRSSEEQGWYNVNPFNVFRGEGNLKLSPATDVWTDTYHLADKTIMSYESQVSGQSPPYPAPSGYSWQKGSTTTTTTKRIDKIIEDAVAYPIPFCRQREVFGKVQGLRPNTRYWPFFDQVNVEQWILKESQEEYRSHMANDDHLRGYPEVDVTIKKHPRAIDPDDHVLISDYKGDMFFSFWLPNNAPVPTPDGNSFTEFDEWEKWIQEQEAEAAKYPKGVDDPRVYDDIGWKFRTGSIPFLLNDVSSNDPADGLSFALSSYIASGSLEVSQRTVYMTQTTSVNTDWKLVQNQDPLAQTFVVDARSGVPGVFVTKVDVFLRRTPRSANKGGTDLAIPIQLQIRGVENGIPLGRPAGDQYVVFKSADECYDVVSAITNLEDLDDVLSHPVTFEFEEPVYLQAGEEYAIALLAECDDYEAFVSTTYGLILGKTEERVSAQPAGGSLFLSQNGTTWTPRQDQNLAYRIYTAKFKDEGAANFFNDKLPKFNHNTARLSVDDSDATRFRVNHVGHGLGVGDRIGLEGLNPTSDYLGVSGANIMDPNLVVDSADIAGYFVRLSSGNFSEVGVFGEDSAVSNQAFNYDDFLWTNLTQEYPLTSIEYEGSFISGYSYAKVDETATADPRFDFTGRSIPLRPGNFQRLSSPRMVANADQEWYEISPAMDSAPSVVISAKLKSNAVSSFGGNKARNAIANGYISDVTPIIDLTRNTFMGLNYLIDNQPNTLAERSELTNVPYFYSDETTPVDGTSPSKHITKPIILNQPANGVRVFVNAYVPPEAEILLYFRNTFDAEGDIYEEPFELIEAEFTPNKNSFNAETYNELLLPFKEYSYLVGGPDGDLEDFLKFQLKIVMKTRNTCQVPVIGSLRAIAVI